MDLIKKINTVEVNMEDFETTELETDDSGVFQRAINEANRTGARVIRLKSNSTYNVSTKIISFDDLTFIGDNTKIVGTQTPKFMDAMDRNLFIGIWFDNYNFVVQSNKEQVSFENCIFTNIGTVAIYYYGGRESYVKNCRFSGILNSSIVIDDEAINITIQDSFFTNELPFNGKVEESSNSAHIYGLSGRNIFVLNNKVYNSGGQGIIFGNNSTSGKGVTYSQAIGNHCEGNGQEGITCFGFFEDSQWTTFGNTILGNTCINNRFHQIEIWQSPDNTVIGNTVDESGTSGNMGAITLFQTNRTICTGNRILNAANNGIAVLFGTDKNIITNNNIIGTNHKMPPSEEATSGHGILLDSNGGESPTNIIIKDNIIESKDTTKTVDLNKWGIYSTTTSMQGNTIRDNQSYGYKGETHYFAKKTTKHLNDVKPVGALSGYDSFVENITIKELGKAGAKYVIKGWDLIETVWVDNRVLTGN